MLEIKGLAKTYPGGEQAVLSELAFQLASGESAALMGASGSGKSTLLHVIGTLDSADAGQVLFEGIDLQQQNDAQRCQFRRQQLGFIFQQYNLLPTLNVLDNILFPRRLLGLSDKLSTVDELIAALDIAPLLKRWPEQLSGGQQQRVAIARALSHQPKLLLADEPTGNLDEQLSQQVMGLLSAQVEQQGCALLLVTHSREAAAHCHQHWRLHNGQAQLCERLDDAS
ncbi:ABC transporter ATP-binding protein [Aliagarivorans marinus]|uniref:ABC transporter ATP-binding protein n=1 Tax=Aliagarivorans marinus TaxID=561965 RepID=UPI0004275EF6|nr:ABC transporter ATP-binding protein [Aliagarivorans marinus]